MENAIFTRLIQQFNYGFGETEGEEQTDLIKTEVLSHDYTET